MVKEQLFPFLENEVLVFLERLELTEAIKNYQTDFLQNTLKVCFL